MNNILSFIASSNISISAAVKYFLRKSSESEVYSTDRFYLYNFRPAHPLYKRLFLKNNSRFFFLNGFFYDEINKKNLEKALEDLDVGKIEEIKRFISSLNGSYNGFWIDHRKQEINIFTDIMGYDKIYYCTYNGSLFFSSFIWPLLLLDEYQIDQIAIGEHLLLGHPLKNKTIFKNIDTIQPGRIERFDFKGKQLGYESFESFPERRNISKSDLIEDFFSRTKRHYDYIQSINPAAKFGSTLTGGNDTRVVLNSMFNNNITPYCTVGYHNIKSRDSNRAEKIAKHYGLNFDSINYSENFEKILLDTIEISNGYTNGIWMGNISLHASDKCNLLYNGFSGDFVAGGNEFDFSGMDCASLAKSALKYRAHFKSLPFKDVISLSSSRFDDFLEEYVSTYESYKDFPIEDLYFLQEKNERNFRRIASFADGIRLGKAAPVFFFHDKQILDFYRSIDLKWYKHQVLHHKISYKNNAFLALMPSANKTNLPSFVIPYISTLIENRFSQKLLNIKNKRKKAVYTTLNNVQAFLKFMSNEPALNFNRTDLQFLDIENFIHSTTNKEIEYSDLDTIKMRVWDLYYTLKFIGELKNDMASKIITLKADPFPNEPL